MRRSSDAKNHLRVDTTLRQRVSSEQLSPGRLYPQSSTSASVSGSACESARSEDEFDGILGLFSNDRGNVLSKWLPEEGPVRSPRLSAMADRDSFIFRDRRSSFRSARGRSPAAPERAVAPFNRPESPVSPSIYNQSEGLVIPVPTIAHDHGPNATSSSLHTPTGLSTASLPKLLTSNDTTPKGSNLAPPGVPATTESIRQTFNRDMYSIDLRRGSQPEDQSGSKSPSEPQSPSVLSLRKQMDSFLSWPSRTLFLFSNRSSVRIWLIQYLYSKVHSISYFCLVLAHFVVLIYDSTTSSSRSSRSWSDWFYLAIFIAYTVHAIAASVAYGAITSNIYTKRDLKRVFKTLLVRCASLFIPIHAQKFKLQFHEQNALYGPQDAVEAILGISSERAEEAARILRSENDAFDSLVKRPTAYLRKSWNRLEVCCVIIYWVTFIVRWAGGGNWTPQLQMTDALTHLKVIHLLQYIPATRMILGALKAGFPLMRPVFLVMAIFLGIYSVTGLLSFNSSLRRSCVWVDPMGVQANYTSSQPCGSWLDSNGTVRPFVYSDGTVATESKGYTCPINSICVSVDDLENGAISFDDIFNSLELVFVVMSQNTYSDIMYKVINAEYQVSALFFITGVVILNYWLLSLLVGIMSSSFSLVWRRLPSKRTKFWANRPIINHYKYLSRSYWGTVYVLSLPLFALLALLDVIFQAVWTVDGTSHMYTWEVFLSTLFGLEVVVRFLLYTPNYRYFYSAKTNILDSVLAVANIVTVSLHSHPTVYVWLTIFMLLRLYRFVALFPVAERTYSLLLGSTDSLIDLTIFYFGVTFILSVIASKMFKGLIPDQDASGENIAVTFGTLSNSFIGMYQVSSTENWTDVLYAVNKILTSKYAQFVAATFLCVWLFFSNFIVVNMFISVMTQNLSSDSSNKRREQAERILKKYSNSKKGLIYSEMQTDTELQEFKKGLRALMAKLQGKQATKDKSHLHGTSSAQEREILKEFLSIGQPPPEDQNNSIHTSLYAALSRSSTMSWFTQPFADFKDNIALFFAHVPPKLSTQATNKSKGQIGFDGQALYRKDTFHGRIDLDGYIAGEQSGEDNDESEFGIHARDCKTWCLFSNTNSLRRFCQHLVPSPHGARYTGIEPRKKYWIPLWYFLLVATVGMIVCACINTPYYHRALTYEQGRSTMSWTWLTYLDLIFAALFLVEFLIKTIADGFHYSPNAYTYSPWNVIDFIVLISMLITLFSDIFRGPVSRYSRGLMSLRALRLITLNPKSEVVFSSVFIDGFGSIMVAIFIGLSVVIPYSVWGVNLFKGRLSYCNDNSVGALGDCINEYKSSPSNWDIWAPKIVTNPYFNYDNFGESLLIQFGVLSLEGWIDVLEAVMSITGEDTNSSPGAQLVNGLYPILYNFIGTVLIMTMFLSIVIRNYAASKDTALLTPDQLSWYYLKKTFRLVTPKLKAPYFPPGSLREVLQKLVLDEKSLYYKLRLWTLAVVTLTMAVYFYQEGDVSDDQYLIAASICGLLIFALMIAKIWVLEWRCFTRDPWNLYALLTSLVYGLFSLIARVTDSDAFDQLYKASIILFLGLWVPIFPNARRFFQVALTNINELATILSTWFIFFLTFAMGFNQTFGMTKIGENGGLFENFRDVPKTLTLLFKMSTGEGWNEILTDYMISYPDCTRGGYMQSDCGDSTMAILLFLSWNIISMYIFCNLFISVIYDTFWFIYGKSSSVVEAEDIRAFQDTWQQLDANGTGYIPTHSLYEFLRLQTGYFKLGIYSTDEDYNVRTILERSKARQSILNPYKVDGAAIEQYLAKMPVQKFKARREVYDLFCLHAFYSAKPNLGIQFHKLMKQFPLYISMDPCRVLNLESFLKLRVVFRHLKSISAANLIKRCWQSYKMRQSAKWKATRS